MERVSAFERFLDRLPPVFAAVGCLGLVAAVVLWGAGPGLDRFAFPVLAASLALLLYYVVERPRAFVRFFTGRSAKYGGNALAMSLAFIGIVALLNVLANRFSYRADLTATKQFTLSPQTVKVLTDLKQPVKLTYFYTQDYGGTSAIDDIVKQFKQHTDKLETENVDVQLRPGVARQYGIEYPGTAVLESGGKRQLVTSTTEGDLISGILKVTRAEAKKVYFVVGHGEPDPDGSDQNGFSSARQALQAENYAVASLNLAAVGKVPADAAVVVLAAPATPLLPQETQALTDYIDNGGKALLLADPDKMAGLPELADRYGVEIGRGAILDVGAGLNGDPRVPVIVGQGYLSSPITASMPAMTVFPWSTMVRAKQADAGAKYLVSPLVQTTAQSWLGTDLSNLTLSPNPQKDVMGPLPIAVSVTTAGPSQAAAADSPPAKSTRLVIVGNVVFATNAGVSIGGNRDFLVNSVNWLAEEEDLISVRAKASVNRQMLLTGPQVNLVGLSSVALLPLAVLGVGALVWWRRK